MKNYRYLLYYILTTGGFTMLMYMVVMKGELLNPAADHSTVVLSQASGLEHFRNLIYRSLSNALPRLLLQIITIIAIARISGFLAKKTGLPAVIGEIIADNDFKKCEFAVLPVYSSEDTEIFSLAGRLSSNSRAIIKILDYYNQIEYNDEMKEALRKLSDRNPGRIETYVSDEIPGVLSRETDLLLVTPEGWHKIIHEKRLSHLPPSLIIRA